MAQIDGIAAWRNGRVALSGDHESPYRDKLRAGYSGVLLVTVLLTAYVCAFADRTVITLLVDPIRSDFGISDSEASLLTGAAFGLFYVVFTIPAGILVDRMGRRGLIGGSVAAWSGMSIFAGLSGSFWQLFAGRAGVGIAEAVITPACFSLIRDRLPAQQRNRAFTAMAMAPYLGSAIALIGGGMILKTAQHGTFDAVPLLSTLKPWQTVLVLLGAAGLPIALLPILLRRDEHRVEPGDGHGAEVGDVLRHMAARMRCYGMLVIYATAGALVGFAMASWVPAMMSRKFALPLDQVGKLAGGIALTAAPAGLLIGGVVIDRLVAKGRDIRLYGAVMAALGTACAVMMASTTATGSAWVCYAAAIFFTSATYPVGATTLAELTPAKFTGKATVIYFLPQNILGGALAASIVALVSDHVFSGPAAISHALAWHCGIFGAIGSGTALLLARSMRSERATVMAGAAEFRDARA